MFKTKKNYEEIEVGLGTHEVSMNICLDTLRKDADKAYKSDKYLGFTRSEATLEINGYSVTVSALIHVRKKTDKVAKELSSLEKAKAHALQVLADIAEREKELADIAKDMK